MQILKGVFDRTGGDLISNGAHFGVCLGIIREWRPKRARIREVVKSEKIVILGGNFKGL